MHQRGNNRRSEVAVLRLRDVSGLCGRLALLTSIRLSLLMAALGILAIGFFRLPETVTTSGELVIGEILAITVGLLMFVAALYERAGGPKRF